MPDATLLHHCPQNHHQYCTLLSLIQALNTNRPVASLAEGVAKFMPSPFCTANVSTFPAEWVCGQSYASNSHTPPKCA